MRTLLVALPVVLTACAAKPPLPPPPSEALRASWQHVNVKVLSADDAVAIDTPPTTLLGRAGLGAGKGALVGTVAGGALGSGTGVLGLILMGGGLVVGGVGGFAIGAFSGDDPEAIAAAAVKLQDAVNQAAMPARLQAALGAELLARGVSPRDDASVVCELRLDRCGLLGWPNFDPDLAPTVHGELRMLRRTDGVAEHTLPFQCVLVGKPFTEWTADPGAVGAAFGDAAKQLAEFLADELTRNVDIRFGSR